MNEFFVECFPDEELLLFLNIPSNLITHCKGSGNVFNKLKKSANCFALLDEDPKTAPHPYLSELSLVSDSKGIKYFKDGKRDHSVVMLCPRFEEWLINAAKEIKIKLSDFNLSENPHYLHSEINGKLKNLKNLLVSISGNESSRINELQRLI